MSAVMLAGIGPVKPFLDKDLVKHSEACGRTEETADTQRCARGARHGAHRRAAVGAHMTVSAVSAEIVGGTLPQNRFSSRRLRHNVLIQHARVCRETARAAARRTGRPAG